MTPEIRHYCYVKGRKLIFEEPELYNKVVGALEGKECCLVIKPRHKKITPNKHAYYRGGILGVLYQTEMFHHLDNKDQIHDLYFAPMFLGYVKLIEINGKTKELPGVRSLSELSDPEMGEFIERVIAHCEVELGVEIYSPEVYLSKYYSK